MQSFIGVNVSYGMERAFSFFMLNPFVVVLTIGTVTCVTILIALLTIIRKWGDA